MAKILLLSLLVLVTLVSLSVDASGPHKKSRKPRLKYKEPSYPDCRNGVTKPYRYGDRSNRYGFCTRRRDRCDKGYECCSLPSKKHYGRSSYTCQECEPVEYCLDEKVCPRGSTKVDTCDFCKIWGIVCEAECVVEKADIGFLLDGSGSVGDANFVKELDFVKEIVAGFTIGVNDVQVGVIQFATTVEVEFPLDEFSSSVGLADKIMAIQRIMGFTATAEALDLARNNLFIPANGMRVDVPQIAFVVTDGVSNNPAATVTAATALRNHGVTIVAVGIGEGIVEAELKAIASGDENVFMINDFDELPAIQMALVRTICNLQDEIAGETSVPDCNPECSEGEECLVTNEGTSKCFTRMAKEDPPSPY